MWCFLFYKLVGDDGATGKCLSTFAIDAQKGQTIAALLENNSQAYRQLTTSQRHTSPTRQSPTYSPSSSTTSPFTTPTLLIPALFSTRYQFSKHSMTCLLKKVGAGGRAVNKPLQRMIAPVPIPEDAGDGKAAEEQHQEPEQAPNPPCCGSSGCPREHSATDAPHWQRGQLQIKQQKDLRVVVLIESCLCLH